MSVELKSPREIELIRKASLVVHEVLHALKDMAKPGVTTRELDQRARQLSAERGVEPAFLGYPPHSRNAPPFPGVTCISVNDEIVHGIPGDRVLRAGDIVSLDYGCSYEGYFGDSALTVAVGDISEEAKELLRATEEALTRAIAQCRIGKRIGDISHAVQSTVEPLGFGVVREFVGHGIGRKMHEAPAVPNFGPPGQGRVLRAGMVLAIEPMVTAGSYETKIGSDGWTAMTKDGSFAAHFEHTVAITEKGPLVLTRP